MFGIFGRLDTTIRGSLRLLQVAFRTGFAAEVLRVRSPKLLRLLLANGLNVRVAHAAYALLHGDRPALVDERRQLTWAQADAEIDRVAAALARRYGVGPRTPVALMMENCNEYVIAWFALFRARAAAVHASYRMTHEELEYQVEHSGPRVVFVTPRALDAAQRLAEARPDLGLSIVLVADTRDVPGRVLYRDLVQEEPDPFWTTARAREGGGEDVVYTSGTTGRPKGAARDYTAYGLVELSRVLERLPLRVGERHLVVAPLHHSGGQAFALLESALGSTLYVRRHFDAEEVLRALSVFEIESVFLVPTLIQRLLDLPEATWARWPISRLRAVISGAAPFSQALRERALARFGEEAVYDFYGATELGWVTLISGPEMARRPGSVGRALAGQQIHIQDEQGRVLGPGEVGRIWVRNRQAIRGYLRDEKATDQARRGEWVTVDDLGSMDADGYLYLAGRARELVISGGVNIYPAEIEEVLARHPDVAEAAVLGVPDPIWGERPVAAVVARQAIRPEQLAAWVREHLSSYKVPRDWRFLPELPRGPTGKVLKGQLADLFGDVQRAWPPQEQTVWPPSA